MRNTPTTILAAGLLVGLAGAAPARADDAKSLFEEKCSICHSLERPTSKRKTREGWEKTVLRMKNVNGAPVTDQQAKAIIEYLAKSFGP